MNMRTKKIEPSNYSVFTKSAIIEAFNMMTEFIYADDPENIFGFTSLAIKLKNMKGIIPDELHEKIMQFTMTDIRNWMLYDVPDIDDNEDEDVEMLNSLYEESYSILRNLYTIAELDMEPYIGSKTCCIKRDCEIKSVN